MPPAQRSSKPVIAAIQALRGIAAALVATMHILAFSYGVSARSPDWGTSDFYRLVFPFGNAGVDLFFVISGAIMFMVVRRNTAGYRASDSIRFLANRATRIYPVYWVSLLGLIWLTPAKLPVGWFDRARAIFLSNFTSPHQVSWTLVYEMHFYVLVALSLGLFRHYAYKVLIIAAALAVVLPIASLSGYTFNSLFLDVLMAEFAFGILVAVAVFETSGAFAIHAIGLGVAGFVAGAFIVNPANLPATRVLAFGVPMALVVYGAIGLEMSGGAVFPKIFVKTGNISYSLYLWHIPLAQVLISHWASRGVGPAIAFFLVTWAILIPLATISYLWIEMPLTLSRLSPALPRTPFEQSQT